jgi:hypothetical protein
VSGTHYAELRGNASLPNLCGVFLRGKNNGSRNDVPEIDLGKYQPDTVGPHQHKILIRNPISPLKDGVGIVYSTEPHDSAFDRLVAPSEGPETQPKSVTVNFYVKIND